MTVIFGALSRNTPDFPPHHLQTILQSASQNGTRGTHHITSGPMLLGHLQFGSSAEQYTYETPSHIYMLGGTPLGIPQTTLPFKSRSKDEQLFAFTSLFSDQNYSSLSQTNGHFAAVSYDKARNTLTIANDPMGEYPVYTVTSDDFVYFSSEYQILLDVLPARKTLDKQFLTDWLLYTFSCHGRTPVEGLQSLPPASIFTAEPTGRTTLSCYDEWDYEIDYNMTLEDHVQSMKETLQSIVTSYVADNRIQSMPITGGYDSRLLMAALPEEIRQSISWATNCSPFLSPEEDRDVYIAKQLSEHYSLKHSVARPESSPNKVKQSGEIFETLRPAKDVDCIHGHFSGYIRGMSCDFAAREQQKERIFRSFFSKQMQEWAMDEFIPISAQPDFHKDENRKLKYYFLNNIRCFMNHDHLGGGKWLNPTSFFLYGLRAPYGANLLCKQLLTIPREYIADGLLFLKTMEAFDPDLFTIPFTSISFPDSTARQLKYKPQKIQLGTDYRQARKPFWTPLLNKYLCSPVPLRRNIYSQSLGPRLFTIHTLLDTPLHKVVPQAVKQHWRYRDSIDEQIPMDFVRLEDWFRYYADSPKHPIQI